MFGKSIWLPKCQVASSRCEKLILLHFPLQMLNDINIKNSWDSLRGKYQLKQITKTRINYNKNVANNENCILRNNGLNFQNSTFNILYKIAFCNKQKRLNKELIIRGGLRRHKGSLFGGTTLKNSKFHFQWTFTRSHRTEPSCIQHPQPARKTY